MGLPAGRLSYFDICALLILMFIANNILGGHATLAFLGVFSVAPIFVSIYPLVI